MGAPGQQSIEKRALEVDLLLEKLYGNVASFLHYENSFQLLVGVILSAQSTDNQVNKILPGLFQRWPSPCDWAKAAREEIEQAVHSTGFFRMKAKHLLETSRRLCVLGGQVPLDFDSLTALPGVGRKSAHVIRGAIGGFPAIIVDTHFGRVCRRLGLSEASDPYGLEKDVTPLIPAIRSYGFSMRVNQHGRKTCHARKPDCGVCILAPLCPSAPLG